jgi:hypothetical protein
MYTQEKWLSNLLQGQTLVALGGFPYIHKGSGSKLQGMVHTLTDQDNMHHLEHPLRLGRVKLKNTNIFFLTLTHNPMKSQPSAVSMI